MATRFYLPASGESPLDKLDVDASWGLTSSDFFRAPLVTEKSDTALASFAKAFPDTTQQGMVFGQWVSKPLADAATLAEYDAVEGVLSCQEEAGNTNAYNAWSLRVVSGDGDTIRGSANTIAAVGGEYPSFGSMATRRISSFIQPAVEAQKGDRIVLELGLWGATSWGGLATVRYGDPSAVDDFAFTENLTTDLCPWLQIAPNLTFGEEASEEVAPPIPYRRRGNSWRRYAT